MRIKNMKALQNQHLQGFLLAEKEGFEPSKPFRGLHDFQSCALDQLGDFSIAAQVSYSFPVPARQRYYYTKAPHKVKRKILSDAEGTEESDLPPPLAHSAQVGNEVVHGVVHGDAHFLNFFPHLCFHGAPAHGQHPSKHHAGRQAGPHTEVKSGIAFHLHHSFIGTSLALPKTSKKNVAEFGLPNGHGAYIIKRKKENKEIP